MIAEIETLMQHWAEQTRRCGMEASLSSPMGTLMEFAGGMPRNLPGPRELMANGAGPDHIAREIEAALARLEHRGERGQLLVKLASLRYLPAPALSVPRQMQLLAWPSTADRTYRNWVQSLHEQVMSDLLRRANQRAA